MENLRILSYRLKLLRYAGNLRLVDINNLSKLYEEVSTNAYRQWENQLRVPNVQSLITISNIFAVSLDWLVGRVDDPYDEKVIERLEKELYPVTFSVENQMVQCIPGFWQVSEKYDDIKLRRENYSLDVRSNILYLFQQLRLMKESPNAFIRRGDGKIYFNTDVVSDEFKRNLHELLDAPQECFNPVLVLDLKEADKKHSKEIEQDNQPKRIRKSNTGFMVRHQLTSKG